MTWSESLYKSIINFKKNNRKKEKKILEKVNKNKTRTRKKTVNSQWTESTSIIKKQIFLRIIVERKNYVFITRKKSIKLKNVKIFSKKSQQKHKHK